MGAEVDRLEVQVESEARRANQQLDSLINRLEKVSSSILKINTGKIRELSKDFNSLNSSVKGLNTNGVSGMVSALKRLSKIDTGNMGNVSKVFNTFGVSMPKK